MTGRGWSGRGFVQSGLVALAVWMAAPRMAQAHLVTSGAGPFFDGVAHFFVSPDDLLVVVAIALLSGLAGKTAARQLVVMLPVAWLTGTMAGIRLAGRIEGCGWISAVTLLAAGLLLGINPKLPPRVFVLMAIVIGGVHGTMNGAAMAATETSALASIGIVVAAGIVALLLSAAAASLTTLWQKIAVRVIGSWVAAIGLLALAWHFR